MWCQFREHIQEILFHSLAVDKTWILIKTQHVNITNGFEIEFQSVLYHDLLISFL